MTITKLQFCTMINNLDIMKKNNKLTNEIILVTQVLIMSLLLASLYYSTLFF